MTNPDAALPPALQPGSTIARLAAIYDKAYRAITLHYSAGIAANGAAMRACQDADRQHVADMCAAANALLFELLRARALTHKAIMRDPQSRLGSEMILSEIETALKLPIPGLDFLRGECAALVQPPR